jgi:ABC-type uncharacterized transport system involved in gliding motility auxiliary subunit
VVTGLYALSQWRDIGRSFQQRNVQYGSIAAGSIAMFLAIVVAVNWMASRRTVRWDLTDTKQFSLSEQTQQIVTNLTSPLTIKVFHGPQESTDRYRDQLEGYQYHSSQVSVEYINAVAKPTEAEAAEVTAVPTLILQYEGRTQRATSADEQAVTNALKKLIEGKAKKAYFTQGHGERDPDDAQNRSGYRGAGAALADENFDVAKLQLAQEAAIPADATVIVVAGATTDFLPQEADLLRTFLTNGGKVLLMIDPPAKGGTQQPDSLIALASEWGIQVGNDLVVDPRGQLIGADASVPVGMPVPHAITRDFKLMTAFRIARSVGPVEGGVEGKVAQSFVQTGDESWAEADVKGLYETGTPDRNLDKGDKGGPVSVAAAVSAPAAADATPPADPTTADAPTPESRLVVFGDSDFAANGDLGFQGNSNLFLNTMNWLAQQEDLIAIRPRDPQDRRIQLTQDQQTRVFWVTLVIIPLLLFGNAVRVYRKRR